MPTCMGSLFWQINDCWPVASWSSIDYFGRWKAQQYFARKSFAPELVTAWIDGDMVKVAAVSDRLEDVHAMLIIQVMDFHGAVLNKSWEAFTLKANRGAEILSTPAAGLLAGAAPESVLLHVAIEGKTLAEDLLYFRPVKDLILPRAEVSVNVKDLGGEFAIGLSSTTLAKNLYLSLDDVDGVFSDNYFDLLPGATKVVRFKPAHPMTAKKLERGLKLMHMALVV